MIYTIGIDPGVSGAVAILEGNELVMVFDMPVVEVMVNKKLKRRISPEMLADELQLYVREPVVAWIERVNAMPGQGVTSMFAFGEAYGLARGVMVGMGVQCNMVTPATWKKALRLPEGKDASRALAAQLWPKHAGHFKRAKDDGRAEAALIAHWATLS